MNLVQNWSWELKPQSGTLKSKEELQWGKYVRTENAVKAHSGYVPKRPTGWVSPEAQRHRDRLVALIAQNGGAFIREVCPYRDKTATALIKWAKQQPRLTVSDRYPPGRHMGRPSVYVALAVVNPST